MADQNINQDRDNGTWGELLTQLDNKDKLDELYKMEKAQVDATGNPAAQSFWSTGRACPKCAGTLRMKEVSEETGHLIVFCRCGAEYYAEDLEQTETVVNDKIHRIIPDDAMLRWMTAREDELNRREAQG